MSKLWNVILATSLMVAACTVLLQGPHTGTLNSATASEPSTVQPSTPTQEQLHQLLLERKRLLEGIAETIKRSADTGRMSMTEYIEARIASLVADLDLCNTKDDRVAVHAGLVKLRRESEAWTERLAQLGQTGQVDLDGARVARLESEMDLLREQLK